MLLRVLTAGTGVVAALGLLALVELALRRVRPPAPRRPEVAQFIAIERAYFRPCDTDHQFVGSPRGPRIVVVGESSGFLLGQRLQDLLARSGAEASVANCALPGSGLVHLQRRFAEALEAEPDVIVVVFGHNFAFPFARSELDLWLQENPRSIRLIDLVRGARGRGGISSPCALEPPPVDELARFLRRAAADARDAGARLVLTTVTPNLLDSPRCDRAPGALDPRVYRARVLRARGRAAEARALLARVAAAHSARAGLELGAWLLADGDPAAARAALAAALADDRSPGRASPAINQAIRDEARAGHALLRDTAATMARRQPDGVTGWETLFDNCHLHDDLFAEEAVGVLAQLGVRVDPARAAMHTEPDAHVTTILGILAQDARGDHPRPGRPDDPFTLAFWRLIARGEPGAERLIDAWPDRAPEMTPRQRARWLAAAADAYRMAGRREEARARVERALAASSEVPAAWVASAMLALGDDRTEDARRDLGRALAIEPRSAEIRGYLDAL